MGRFLQRAAIVLASVAVLLGGTAVTANAGIGGPNPSYLCIEVGFIHPVGDMTFCIPVP